MFSAYRAHQTEPHAEAAALIQRARHAVAMTGAGVSTRSGIPDFRSPGSGLWEKHNPMEVASLSAFRRDPGRFYAWARELGARVVGARPNAAHRALAALETAGLLKAIITQNVDGLHQRAGSREVLEIHGDFRTATCISCGLITPTEASGGLLEWNGVPRCPTCAGVLKPNVVFIGEQLPQDVLAASFAHLEKTDVLVVAGSSLEMAPASEFPLSVYNRGGRLVVVNLEATYVDRLAEVVVRADVTEALPRIASLCGL